LARKLRTGSFPFFARTKNNDKKQLNAYHGAKNLMNTVFPPVMESKFSGVRLGTSAATTAAMARTIPAAIFMIILVCLFVEKCVGRE